MSRKWPAEDSSNPYNVRGGFLVGVPDEMWDEYYYSLGQMMHAFGETEKSLNHLFTYCVEIRLYDGWPDAPPAPFDEDQIKNNPLRYFSKVFSSLFGGMRTKMLGDAFKRLARAIDVTDEQMIEINKILSHLSEMQYLRDRLAHHGATPDMTNVEGWFYTENTSSVFEDSKKETIYFKPYMLRACAQDLPKIPRLLRAIYMADHDAREKNRQGSAYKSEAELNEIGGVNMDWLYKSNMLNKIR